MDEIQTLLTEAREKALAGDLVEAKALREKATALREIKEEEIKALGTPKPVDTSARLPFSTGDVQDGGGDRLSANADAVKSVYVKRYGSIDASTEQVMKELYGSVGIKGVDDYYTLRALKFADLARYCKHGQSDPRLGRLLLYTPDQVIKGIMADVSVGENNYSFKATMVNP